jgi:predicted HTH transcriptional regulator
VTHLAHNVHANSLAAYEAEETKLSARAQAVLAWISQHGPHTDREVMKGMGFQEPNSVRPRITELIDAGKLMEVCSRRCPVTGKSVRVVDVRGQRGLFT